MTRTHPSRHDNDHRADDHSSQSRANEQRVNTIATLPGLVPNRPFVARRAIEKRGDR